jgi:hypothetical protein
MYRHWEFPNAVSADVRLHSDVRACVRASDLRSFVRHVTVRICRLTHVGASYVELQHRFLTSSLTVLDTAILTRN